MAELRSVKKLLRRNIEEFLKNVSPDEIRRQSGIIFEKVKYIRCMLMLKQVKVLQNRWYRDAERISCYVRFGEFCRWALLGSYLAWRVGRLKRIWSLDMRLLGFVSFDNYACKNLEHKFSVERWSSFLTLLKALRRWS